MSESFDPYYKWLGIAPAEQPPNHYRLLGLNLFEPDPDVIENGSDRQMTHLRSFQSGPRMRECQQLLNEVAAARVVLLDSEKKAAYDAELRASTNAVELPPQASAAPLPPAPVLPPTASLPVASPAAELPRPRPQKASSPVVVAKGAPRRRKRAAAPGVIIAGVMIGLALLFACGYGIFLVLRPPPPVEKPRSRLKVASSRKVTSARPAGSTATTLPKVHTPVTRPDVAGTPSSPSNVFIDALDEYRCTPGSQPRLTIDSSFDETRSWRLSMRVTASFRASGTLLCWGDNRAGQDSICIKAGPDHISGWVADNSRRDGGTALPNVPIDWSSSSEIEIIHDAVSQVLQVRVDQERHNVAVAHPPRADRPMPVHLGGVGMGAQSFPCTVHDLRWEQLTDPVNLLEPSETAAPPAPGVAATGESTDVPQPNRSLGDLVAPVAVSKLPGAGKLPVPDEGELRVAREEIQKVFADELSRDRTPEESGTLAERMIADAARDNTRPAVRYALLEAAINTASQGGAIDAVSNAIRALDTAFVVDLPHLKAGAARQLARVAEKAWEHKSVVELLEVVIDECLAEDRFDLALPLVDALVDAARKSKDSSAIARGSAQLRKVKSRNARYEPVQAALGALENDSNNPEANETVGRHLCLVKGKWERGLPYLIKGTMSELRTVAERDVQQPGDADAQFDLGNDWMDTVPRLERSTRLQALLRAEYWYRLALAQQPGLNRSAIETRLETLGKEVGEMAELPAGAVLVMTFEPSTLKRRGFALDASQHGHVGIVKGAVVAEGVAGNALGFDGKDDYVEIASTPWLSAPSAFTISAWVNVLSWKSPNGAQDYLISKDDWKPRRPRGYVLRYRQAGTLNFTLGASVWHDVASAKKASLGQWHHVAMAYDGKAYRLFMDGEREGNELVARAIEPSNVPLRIGQAAFRKERGIRGRIDEVAIFNRALSPDEVRTVFRIGKAGRPLIK